MDGTRGETGVEMRGLGKALGGLGWGWERVLGRGVADRG